MSVRSLFIVGLLGAASTVALAQEIPRTASGRPDLQGIWQTTSRAAYNLEDHAASYLIKPGRGVVQDGPIPYLPAALEQRDANFAGRAELDPLNKCWFPGVPRIMALEHPFHIFQTDEQVALTFEWTQVWRLIYTDGEPESRYAGIESFMGHSRGRWEGDTLVVEVKDMNGRTWLDAAGNFGGPSMTLVERYTLEDADTIRYEVTITDPETFSRPWTLSYPLQRQSELDRVLEYQCQAEKEEANGDFERDERNWYPAPIPEENAPFEAEAGGELPTLALAESSERNADGHPDISGYYNADAGGSNYGLESKERNFLIPASRGVVIDPPDGRLPYQDWARAERMDRELPHRGYDDPTAHCFVSAGVPRSLYVPSPFLILQPPGYVVFLHERMSWRAVPLYGREHLPDNIRLWMGDSVGRWEGDTLYIDSRNFNGKAWLNEVGDVTSHRQRVLESFTPVAENELIYRATVVDPIPYTRPWTMEIPLHRSDDELLEVACLEDNNDLEHLRDVRDAWRAQQQQEAQQ